MPIETAIVVVAGITMLGILAFLGFMVFWLWRESGKPVKEEENAADNN